MGRWYANYAFLLHKDDFEVFQSMLSSLSPSNVVKFDFLIDDSNLDCAIEIAPLQTFLFSFFFPFTQSSSLFNIPRLFSLRFPRNAEKKKTKRKRKKKKTNKNEENDGISDGSPSNVNDNNNVDENNESELFGGEGGLDDDDGENRLLLDDELDQYFSIVSTTSPTKLKLPSAVEETSKSPVEPAKQLLDIKSILSNENNTMGSDAEDNENIELVAESLDEIIGIKTPQLDDDQEKLSNSDDDELHLQPKVMEDDEINDVLKSLSKSAFVDNIDLDSLISGKLESFSINRPFPEEDTNSAENQIIQNNQAFQKQASSSNQWKERSILEKEDEEMDYFKVPGDRRDYFFLTVVADKTPLAKGSIQKIHIVPSIYQSNAPIPAPISASNPQPPTNQPSAKIIRTEDGEPALDLAALNISIQFPRSPAQNPRWTPLKPLVYFRVHTKKTTQDQDNLCAGCSKQLKLGIHFSPFHLFACSKILIYLPIFGSFSQQKGLFSTVRYCEYTGKYFCSNCHENNTFFIPARILQNWDLSQFGLFLFFYFIFFIFSHFILFHIIILVR